MRRPRRRVRGGWPRPRGTCGDHARSLELQMTRIIWSQPLSSANAWNRRTALNLCSASAVRGAAKRLELRDDAIGRFAGLVLKHRDLAVSVELDVAPAAIAASAS